MTLIITPMPCAEKKIATYYSSYNSDFPSTSGTSGYSGRESVSLTVETVLGNLLYSCTEGPVN